MIMNTKKALDSLDQKFLISVFGYLVFQKCLKFDYEVCWAIRNSGS